MPVRMLALPSRFAEQIFKTRTRRILLVVLIGVLYVLSIGYHAFSLLVDLVAGEVVYHLVVLLCYGLLYLVLSRYYAAQRLGPLRVFWGIAVMAGILLGAMALIPQLAEPGVFDPETGFPLDARTVGKMSILSLLEAGFGILILVRLRELVLFKRTRRSMRMWYAMMGFMVLGALNAIMAAPADPPSVTAMLFLAAAVVLMVANSFRLSWIVRLSFQQKLFIILFSGAAVVLLALLVRTPVSGLMPMDSYPFARTYSFPINLLTLFSIIFAILYSVTTCLSLLFHLPTTSDYQQKAGEVEALHSLSRLTGDVLDLERLVATIVASPVETGLGEASWLALVDLKTGSLKPRIAATRNLTPTHVNELIDVGALCNEAWQRRGAVLLNHAAGDHRVHARPGDGIESVLVTPLIVRNEMLGALFVSKEVSLGFEPDDVSAICTFADQVALALENARMFEERLEKERLTREWAIAREVQQKLLPQSLPIVPGGGLAVASVSAYEVGGDYYDFVQIDPERWAFIVADVSGKGASAAFYMAVLKGIFQSLSGIATTPSSFLARANEALMHSMEKNVFISVVYGVLDLKAPTLTLARAGHCPAMMARSNGQVRTLRTPGLGLGLDKGALFGQVLAEEKITLTPGDAFVFYTDGVVESRNEASEEYGYDRLMAALSRHCGEEVFALHAALLEDLHQFIGGAAYDDDMTLLVLKWTGCPEEAIPAHADAVTSNTGKRQHEMENAPSGSA